MATSLLLSEFCNIWAAAEVRMRQSLWAVAHYQLLLACKPWLSAATSSPHEFCSCQGTPCCRSQAISNWWWCDDITMHRKLVLAHKPELIAGDVNMPSLHQQLLLHLRVMQRLTTLGQQWRSRHTTATYKDNMLIQLSFIKPTPLRINNFYRILLQVKSILTVQQNIGAGAADAM